MRWLLVLSLAFGIVKWVPALSALNRVSASALKFPATPLFPGYQLSNAFGDLTFAAPVQIAFPPGDTNRLFVVERAGRVQVITNLAAPNQTSFLDLRGRTASYNIESGMLGMTFHPGFATNGFFFVFRTALMPTIGYADVLTRYQVTKSSPQVVDLSSETTVFAISDPSDEHNAGDIQFGPDGYLYVAMGDAGPFLAGQANKQPIDDGLGAGILRVDVDGRAGSLPPNPLAGATLNYRIPPDNPFVGVMSYQGKAISSAKVRTEFFAVGFRNPWRMSFDRVTGRLFCGDVGSDQREEVNLVVRGANYGWPYFEGSISLTPRPASIPNDFVFTPPVMAYGHGAKADQGEAVVGGLVYRGMRIPQLVGRYLFADNVRGHIWSLDYNPAVTNSPWIRITGDPGIAAFGVDPRDQEVLVANHLSGAILKLVYTSPELATFPPTLADTGVFKDLASLSPSEGMVSYELNSPFWSDFAIKTRWFGMVGTTNAIQFSPINNWSFPTGALWIKHFEMEMTNGVPASRRRLETRFLVKNVQGVYAGTYKWDSNQSNATLVSDQGLDEILLVRDGSLTRTQTWRYPSRAECSACHTAAGGYALGFRTSQLNRAHDYSGSTENQISALSSAGYFTSPVTNDLLVLRNLVTATNLDYPVEYRARSYLAANCSQCHQTGSRATLDVFWDARFELSIADTLLLGNYVQPGDPGNSRLLQKITNLADLMPPVGSSVLNSNGVNVIREWITGYPQRPWTNSDVGSVLLPGSASINAGSYTVGGSGRDIWGASDEFQFLHQRVTNNTQITARFVSQRGGSPLTKAGLMIRQSALPDAPYGMVSRLGDGSISFQRRVQVGGTARASVVSGGIGPQWMKLTREADTFRAQMSSDGKVWLDIAQESIPMGSETLLGFASSSRDVTSFNMASFDSVQILSADWAEPSEGANFTAPAKINLRVEVSMGSEKVRKVSFFEGTNRITDLFSQPYEYVWTNRFSGDVKLVAKVTDANGSELILPTRTLHILESAPGAQVETVDVRTQGAWKGVYGTEGFVLVGDSTNLPPGISLNTSPVFHLSWQSPSSDRRALVRASGSGAVAAAWTAPSLSMGITLRDNRWHRIALYCVDFDRAGRRQLVEVRDGGSGGLLASRDINGFQDGAYLSWAVRGHVVITVTGETAASAVLSGIFVDPSDNKPPIVTLTHPSQGLHLTLPQDILVEATASDPDGFVQKVDVFANDVRLASFTAPPYRFTWPTPIIGDYEIIARATDNFGEVVDSAAVDVTLDAPPSSAIFLGFDDVTQGTWKGNYGSEGYQIAAHASVLPPVLALSRPATRSFVWQEPTSDSRALRHVKDGLGIASCWVDSSGLVTHLSFLDGLQHGVTAYFVDWDSVSRKATVNVYDETSNSLLDTRAVTGFHGGEYLSWLMVGRVRFEVVAQQGNVVMSGLFFDPSSRSQPSIRSLTLTAVGEHPQITLTWLAAPNRSYHVQSSSNIVGGVWTDLDPAVKSTGFEVHQTLDVAPNQPQLFFRIIADP